MAQMPSFDFLRPLGEENRDEYILVQFHRLLKNTNMSLLRNIITYAKQDRSVMELFPLLPTYAAMTPDECYHTTIMFNTPASFIFNLSKETLSSETCQQYAASFMDPILPEKLHTTRLQEVLFNLLQAQFIKKIYVQVDKETTEIGRYLLKYFVSESHDTRMDLIEGPMDQVLLRMPEITTVFMSNFSDLDKAYQQNPQVVDGKYIIIAHGYDNLVPVDPSNPDKGLTYAGLDLANQLHQAKRAEMAYMYPYCIPINTQGGSINAVRKSGK